MIVNDVQCNFPEWWFDGDDEDAGDYGDDFSESLRSQFNRLTALTSTTDSGASRVEE